MPPYDSDVMEFRYGVWQGVSPLYTESGRQLGEENARPFLFNDHIPAETLPCKYSGSRAGRAINISALRIAMTHYDAATAITRAIIRQHAATASIIHRTDAKNTTQPGVWDLYIIALAGLSLVSYSVRKHPARPEAKTIRDDVASQYQFIAGIFMICRHMIDTNCDLIAENNAVTAEQLYQYADEHEIFTSFNGMVCAGSTRKITDFLELCITEMDAAFAHPSDESATAALSSIIDHPNQWYHYALLTVELGCFTKTARFKKRIEQRLASASEDRQRIATYDKIAGYCVSLMPVQDAFPDGPYEAAILARQNQILATLNRPKLKRIKRRLLRNQLGQD